MYFFKNHPEIETKCINTTVEELQKYPEFHGRLSPGRYSLAHLWFLLRAEKIVIDAGNNFFGNFKIYQLWHGTGFKDIGFLKRKDTLIERVKYFFLARQLKLVVATSEADKIRKMKSFKSTNVYVTGSPRNDFLLDPSVNEHQLREVIGLPTQGKFISYLPTFRENKNFVPFSKSFYEKLNSWLSQNGYYFLIKKHPNDKEFNLPDHYSHILDLGDRDLDTHQILRLSAVVISDYSGVISDFALLQRPILLFGHDYEDYLKECRKFFYQPHTLLKRGLIKTEDELFQSLREVCNIFDINENREFLEKFHFYKDSDSSRRVFEFIMGN